MKTTGRLVAGGLLSAALLLSSAGTARADSSFYFGFSVPLPPVHVAPAPPVYHYPGYYGYYYQYPRYYAPRYYAPRHYAPYPRHYRHYYPRPYRGYYYGPHIGGWWRVR